MENRWKSTPVKKSPVEIKGDSQTGNFIELGTLSTRCTPVSPAPTPVTERNEVLSE